MLLTVGVKFGCSTKTKNINWWSFSRDSCY